MSSCACGSLSQLLLHNTVAVAGVSDSRDVTFGIEAVSSALQEVQLNRVPVYLSMLRHFLFATDFVYMYLIFVASCDT